MFKRKKKKTGVQTPEFRKPTPPPMPPMKPAKENINNLRIKTIESIKIEAGKNGVDGTARIEITGLETATNPTISTQSSSTEFCSYIDGKMYDMQSVSFRDAFAPGATMYLVGIFEDWVTGELIYGEYDVLNYTFDRKENDQCKEQTL
jgi:hypothetical protein